MVCSLVERGPRSLDRSSKHRVVRWRRQVGIAPRPRRVNGRVGVSSRMDFRGVCRGKLPLPCPPARLALTCEPRRPEPAVSNGTGDRPRRQTITASRARASSHTTAPRLRATTGGVARAGTSPRNASRDSSPGARRVRRVFKGPATESVATSPASGGNEDPCPAIEPRPQPRSPAPRKQAHRGARVSPCARFCARHDEQPVRRRSPAAFGRVSPRSACAFAVTARRGAMRVAAASRWSHVASLDHDGRCPNALDG